MVNLPGAIPLNKIGFCHASKLSQLSTVNQLGVGDHNHPLTLGLNVGKTDLLRSCARNHSYCEVVGLDIVPYTGNTVSLLSCLTSGSYSLSASSIVMVPGLGEEV